MKIFRPSIFATAASQEEPHPFVAVSVFPVNKASFFILKEGSDEDLKLWKAVAWHPSLLFVKEPAV